MSAEEGNIPAQNLRNTGLNTDPVHNALVLLSSFTGLEASEHGSYA